VTTHFRLNFRLHRFDTTDLTMYYDIIIKFYFILLVLKYGNFLIYPLKGILKKDFLRNLVKSFYKNVMFLKIMSIFNILQFDKKFFLEKFNSLTETV